MYRSFVIWSACPLNIICFLATTIAVIFYDTELYCMTSWDSELLWEWQCSVPPRLELFNLFTPTPGPLGHNSSVIVFFWENKPGSWLPQNCLLLVFWLVRWGQLWPLIGHMPHWAPGHWAPTVPHPAIVWCLLQQSTFSLSRQQRVTSLPSWSSMSLIFWVIAESFRWDKQPPGLVLNSGSLSGCKVGAIIYKVKTGWVPLDSGENVRLASDWSAFVILTSDWSTSSYLPFDWPGLGRGHKMVSAGVRL